MPSYKRPGTYVNEFLTPNRTVGSGGGSQAAFVGAHFRGPTDEATYVSSWTEFVTRFGGFPPVGTAPTELPFAVFNYFSNGGRGAYVARVLGTGAAVASVTLDDREPTTPVATLQVSALNAGVWGNDLRVSVVDRDAANGRFDLIVYEGGTTDAFVVERWLDVTMVATDARHVETVINSPISGSAYISVSDVGSATAAPNNTPAVVAGSALTGGSDGSAPTSTELTAAVTAGTSPLDNLEGQITVNMPGETTVATLSALLTYAEDRGTFFVVIDPPVNSNPAAAVAYVETLPASSYGAVYYPYLTVPDPNSNATGATRSCPPGPFVVGKIAEVDTLRGVWKAPAGLGTPISNVVAVERKFSNSDLDTLNEGHVNAIRQIPGSGTVVMGARTLKKSTADKYVNVRRTLNLIKDTLVRSTDFAIFENNDQALWNTLTSVVSQFLSGLHQVGGLRGDTPAEAFYVKCDEELNTPAVIASGEVRIEIGVALQQPAEFIVIRVGQWEGGQSATEA